MTLTYQGKLFAEYPDVVSVKQMCIMLGGISMKTAYKLLGNGEIHHLKIGKSFKIPKVDGEISAQGFQNKVYRHIGENGSLWYN